MKNFVLLLGYSLVEDVCRAKDYDSEEWWNVLNNMILQTLHLENCYLLSESAKLATAMTIIGSRKFIYFPIAFQLLRIWNTTGGCYWVVQEEILRHYILYKIRELIDCGDLQLNEKNIIQYINNEIQSIDLFVASSAHEILHGRIVNLKEDIIELIRHIIANHDALEVFYKYCLKYPLASFIPWFLNWGHTLLISYDSNHYYTPVLLRLQQELECKKNLSRCTKSIQSSVSSYVSKDDLSTTVFKLLSNKDDTSELHVDIDHILKSRKHNRNNPYTKYSMYLNKTSCLDHTAITTKSDNNISSVREHDNNDVILADTTMDRISDHTNTISSRSFSTTEYQYGEYEYETDVQQDFNDAKDLYTHLKHTFWQIFTPTSK